MYIQCTSLISTAVLTEWQGGQRAQQLAAAHEASLHAPRHAGSLSSHGVHARQVGGVDYSVAMTTGSVDSVGNEFGEECGELCEDLPLELVCMAGES